MQAATRRLLRALVPFARPPPPPSSSTITTLARGPAEPLNRTLDGSLRRSALAVPWAAIQTRGAKVLGSDVRLGNVIQRKGTQSTTHAAWKGRSHHTAGYLVDDIRTWSVNILKVELRDVDTGNKITERFRTDEAIERVFVEEKSFTYLYEEGDSITLMEPSTFEQLEVPKELFGKAVGYLKDDMTVTLQYYDGKPMSASVPHRVTCTVVEAQPHTKGLTAAPQYKRVVLDNGLTVQVPPFVEAGDKIVINTTDDSYITRA